jgi:hypothetical protein
MDKKSWHRIRSMESNGIQLRSIVACFVMLLIMVVPSNADDLVLTPNMPMDQFQNRQEGKPYNFDAPPEGMFRAITLAEGFDEEFGFRRQTEIIPLNPATEFHFSNKPVFIVFQLYQHFQSFKVFGVCYAEQVASHVAIARDAALITMEDESGYLKLSPPIGGWKKGRYRVEIHVGEQINNISLVGAMRFTVAEQFAQEA